MKKLSLLGGILLTALAISGCGGDENTTTVVAGGEPESQVVLEDVAEAAEKQQPPTELEDIYKRVTELSEGERSKLQDASQAAPPDGRERVAPPVNSLAAGQYQAEGCNPSYVISGWTITECSYVYNHSGGWTRVYTYSCFKYPHLWVYDGYGVLGHGRGWIQFA
jgi:hypothetical protein